MNNSTGILKLIDEEKQDVEFPVPTPYSVLEVLMRLAALPTACLMLALPVFSQLLCAQEDYENPPISYSDSEPHNKISELQKKIDSGEVKLEYEQGFGYLPAVLKALEIPQEAQVLVFSKTSLQLRRISPRTPRAIYFSDDMYIGFCQAGDVLEVSAVDPNLGTVFYSLDQHAGDTMPRFQRHVDNCVVCHSSSRTENVPGHLVRSLFVDNAGYPVLSAGSRSVNHTTPMEDRWGGWYVTGQHGAHKHQGNLTVEDDFRPAEVDNTAGQNRKSLSDLFDTTPYLTPHSDIVALMVLEHQSLVHNRITRANFTTRQALDYEVMMNKVLENDEGTRLDSTTRRISSAGEKLLEAILLVDEAPLTGPIVGTSGYAEWFVTQGPRDSQGRSLRDLDLTRRMFRYPCSYLIYSDSFQQLPEEMQNYFWPRLRAVLKGEDTSEKFAHLSPEDRQALYEILLETVPGLKARWEG
ncbi:MAG: hypothetical protein KDA88_10100 [Planctomycetaceae bacterium]|nr:hypothetical protein [Planctomycetaceae bacterium]